MEHELTRFPPILQVLGLILLGTYVSSSIVGRLSDRFEWMWDSPRDVHKPLHVLEYTIVPALMFCVAAAAVVYNWNPGAPWSGGWTVGQLVLGPVAALVGLLLVALATTVNRRRGASASDPSQPLAWVPFVALLVGMGLMASGIFSLGRTLKRNPAPAGVESSAPR